MKSEIILFSCLVCLVACAKNEPAFDEPLPGGQKAFTLNGDYVGQAIFHRQNSINGASAAWSDTFQLQFSIDLPHFKWSTCKGEVAIQTDTISFESGTCACWCDCNPYVDCGGNILLGSRFFSFDGDSLIMWSESGSVDTLSVPGWVLGYSGNYVYRCKKQ